MKKFTEENGEDYPKYPNLVHTKKSIFKGAHNNYDQKNYYQKRFALN